MTSQVNISSPTGVNSAPNLGQAFPRSELFPLNLRHVYAQGVEICPKSEARFSEVGIICPQSGARFSEVGIVSPKSTGRFSEVGIVPLESEARFSDFGMISPGSGAYK